MRVRKWEVIYLSMSSLGAPDLSPPPPCQTGLEYLDLASIAPKFSSLSKALGLLVNRIYTKSY